MITTVCLAQYSLNIILLVVIGVLLLAFILVLLVADAHIKDAYRKLEEE